MNGFRSATTRPGIEMQVYRIPGQAHPHYVAHVDVQASLLPLDVHVVFPYRKPQFMAFVENGAAERVVRPLLYVRTVCQAGHVVLQFEITKIIRREQRQEENQAGEDRDRRRDPPARNRLHGCSPGSLEDAQSSSQRSSEWGVHSGFSRPEICNSSSFRVPW